jgi:hypothetical protein
VQCGRTFTKEEETSSAELEDVFTTSEQNILCSILYSIHFSVCIIQVAANLLFIIASKYISLLLMIITNLSLPHPANLVNSLLVSSTARRHLKISESVHGVGERPASDDNDCDVVSKLADEFLILFDEHLDSAPFATKIIMTKQTAMYQGATILRTSILALRKFNENN